MDMKSVTDRAARTLLWTELFRGGCQWGEVGVGHGCSGEESNLLPALCYSQDWA